MKTDERRAELRRRLLEAAERNVAAEGLQALKTRQLAAEVGCALGQIYNIFPDLDSLILAVNARTLDELDERLAAASSAGGASTPSHARAVLLAQAQVYLAFAKENGNRWQAVFQHRMTEPKRLPDWYREQRARMFSHVDRPLRTLLPELSPAERAALGRSIFSAVHGVVWLGVEQLLGPQSAKDLTAELATIVLAIVEGLKQRGRAEPAAH